MNIRFDPLKILCLAAAVAAGLCAAARPASAADDTGVRGTAEEQPLDQWVAEQEGKSWAQLQKNISPAEPKTPGGPAPRRGIVVAALSKNDPDYYFHWVRDSSIVMLDVIKAFESRRPYAEPGKFQPMMRDFLELSRSLQRIPSEYGLGEPRYTVDGKADTIPWSRPQFDGPALRALAVMEYLKAAAPQRRAPALKVLKTDLDFIAAARNRRGFDIWEEYKADNYNTRLVQLAALEKGARWFGPRYQKACRELETLLDDHWDPARGFMRSQLAIAATDGYTSKKTDLDSAVIVTVMDADRDAEAHSVLDDRIQATVAVLETLFRGEYAVNNREDMGLGYGRYAGDSYYGGNPWYLITAYYAQFYYRLARRVEEGRPFRITKINAGFVRGLLPGEKPESLAPGTEVTRGHALYRPLLAALTGRGDGIMRRIRFHTPADGQLFEQFDKNTGQPVSSLGIGWAHAAFLGAAMERARLMAGAAGTESPAAKP